MLSFICHFKENILIRRFYKIIFFYKKYIYFKNPSPKSYPKYPKHLLRCIVIHGTYFVSALFVKFILAPI